MSNDSRVGITGWPARGICAAAVLAASTMSCVTATTNAPSPRTAGGAAPTLTAVRDPVHAVLSPTGEQLAYVIGDSLWVAPLDGGAPHAVAGGVRGELASPFAMLAWSPDAHALLYRSGFAAGDAGTSAGELRILDLTRSGTATRLLPDSLQQSLRTFQTSLAGGPAWSPDGRYIAVLAFRQGDPAFSLQVYVADLHEHSVRRWTAEGRRRFSVAWSPDSRWLAVASGEFTGLTATIELLDRERAGSKSRLLYRAPTALLRGLLWSPDGRLLFAQDRARKPYLLSLTSTYDATIVKQQLPALTYAAWIPGDTTLLATDAERMSKRVVTVSVSSGAIQYRTGPDTNASAIGIVPARAGQPPLIVHRMESGEIPPDIWGSSFGSAVNVARRNITKSNATFARATLPRARIYQWVRGDGSQGLAQLLLPRGTTNASVAAHLPLVVIPYGAYINAFPEGDYFLDEGILALVARGYAVVKPNTRGTASERDDNAQYGALQLQDTELLLTALEKDGTIDPRRVAAIGHSHGGAMAYYYLTHSTRFCAVAAVNGRADWILQARYPGDGFVVGALGGTPDSLPERYREFSPAANARRATAPLLAVAGDLDTQILAANVTIMRDSLRAAGKDVEMIRFPDEGHLLLKPENRRRFWDRAFLLLKRAC